jgi:hypothetical protein
VARPASNRSHLQSIFGFSISFTNRKHPVKFVFMILSRFSSAPKNGNFRSFFSTPKPLCASVFLLNFATNEFFTPKKLNLLPTLFHICAPLKQSFFFLVVQNVCDCGLVLTTVCRIFPYTQKKMNTCLPDEIMSAILGDFCDLSVFARYVLTQLRSRDSIQN